MAFIFRWPCIFAWIGLFGHIPDSEELEILKIPIQLKYSADSALIGKFYIEKQNEIGL